MGTTEAIAGVRQAVETLAAAHGEAPVSMSAKITSPHGVAWTLTVRSGATKAMVSAVVQLVKDVEAGMVKGGWKPYGNGYGPHPNGRHGHPDGDGSNPPPPAAAAPGGRAQPNGKGKNSYLAPDGTPMCAVHGVALEPSQYGGFYCPLPGDGKNGFCTARYKP